jgi:thiol:disulfide interchange protein DsbD
MKHLFSLFALLFGSMLFAEDNDPKRMVIDAEGNLVPRSSIKTVQQSGKVEIRFDPPEAKRGQTVTLRISVQPIASFWTYVSDQPEVAKDPTAPRNNFEFPELTDLVFVGDFKDPSGFKSKPIPGLNLKDIRYYPGPAEVVWERKAVVASDAKPGEKKVSLRRGFINSKGKQDLASSQIMICDDSDCYYVDRSDMSATLKILDDQVPIDPKYKDEVEKLLATRKSPAVAIKKEDPVRSNPPTPKETPEVHAGGLLIPSGRDFAADIDTVLKQLPPPESNNAGFIAFLLTAMFWGAVTLLTPCVFPMIPITVSYFIKQGEKKVHNPLMMAIVYTGTIVIVLGLSSVTLLSTFQDLSVNPFTNIALGLLFLVFAFSLFGMFDIRLPGFMARFTSEREGSGGYLGVIFMACSFTIVSFTCVAPFLGGFSGMAASGNFSKFQLAMGGLVFAATFAAPFFLLALFPSLMKKLPKSGDWMNTVKVVMGFLELAAALKFFRTAELRWTIPPQIFSYDFVLSMWVVLLVFCSLYMLGMYRLPHDYPQEHIGVPRMLFGVICLTLAIYLLPALFAKAPDGSKQRPGGMVYAWVDAFLLPEPSAAELLNKGDLAWSGDLLRAVEDARTKNQLLFLDFTGVTCSNCKLNEKNVFVKENVKELFRKYHLVQLYTDTVPEPFYESPPDFGTREDHAIAVKKFQLKAFGTQQLPLYVILKPLPDGKIERVGVYTEGKINDEAAFVEFLRKPLR